MVLMSTRACLVSRSSSCIALHQRHRIQIGRDQGRATRERRRKNLGERGGRAGVGSSSATRQTNRRDCTVRGERGRTKVLSKRPAFFSAAGAAFSVVSGPAAAGAGTFSWATSGCPVRVLAPTSGCAAGFCDGADMASVERVATGLSTRKRVSRVGEEEREEGKGARAEAENLGGGLGGRTARDLFWRIHSTALLLLTREARESGKGWVDQAPASREQHKQEQRRDLFFLLATRAQPASHSLPRSSACSRPRTVSTTCRPRTFCLYPAPRPFIPQNLPRHPCQLTRKSAKRYSARFGQNSHTRVKLDPLSEFRAP